MMKNIFILLLTLTSCGLTQALKNNDNEEENTLSTEVNTNPVSHSKWTLELKYQDGSVKKKTVKSFEKITKLEEQYGPENVTVTKYKKVKQ